MPGAGRGGGRLSGGRGDSAKAVEMVLTQVSRDSRECTQMECGRWLRGALPDNSITSLTSVCRNQLGESHFCHDMTETIPTSQLRARPPGVFGNWRTSP
jgi:hypothetical protein